jgi:hypothetical protein
MALTTGSCLLIFSSTVFVLSVEPSFTNNISKGVEKEVNTFFNELYIVLRESASLQAGKIADIFAI